MNPYFERLRNIFRRDTEAIIARIAHHRYATVASVNPADHSVRLMYQPDGILSGWVPDASAFATQSGYGIVMPLTVGDQVLVAHAHGDIDNPVVTGRLFSAVDLPPVSPATGKAVQPGEAAIFTNGAWLHLSGGIVHGEATLFSLKGNMVLDGNLTVTGDQTVTGAAAGSTGSMTTRGEIVDLNGAHGSLDDLRTAHNDHDHTGVQRGGASTDGPNLTR